MAHSPCFYLPLPVPLSPPCTSFYLLGTLLAVTGIVHLGLRLLVNWPLLSQPSPKPSPLQIPRTPTAQRLTKTTSGIFRLLLFGTFKSRFLAHPTSEQSLIKYLIRILSNISFMGIFRFMFMFIVHVHIKLLFKFMILIMIMFLSPLMFVFMFMIMFIFTFQKLRFSDIRYR